MNKNSDLQKSNLSQVLLKHLESISPQTINKVILTLSDYLSQSIVLKKEKDWAKIKLKEIQLKNESELEKLKQIVSLLSNVSLDPDTKKVFINIFIEKIKSV